MKTNKLIGSALDWAVAKALGTEFRYMASSGGDYNGNWWWQTRYYSTDWSQGGPIIELEKIQLTYNDGADWGAYIWTGENFAGWGSTPLIAAMRCLVASKLGDEVDIPDELMEN